MTTYQNGPTVRLARLKKRETKDGRVYFSGFMGGNKVLLFQDKSEPEAWNLLLQEPTEDDRARWEQWKSGQQPSGRTGIDDGPRISPAKTVAPASRASAQRPTLDRHVSADRGAPFDDRNRIPFFAA